MSCLGLWWVMGIVGVSGERFSAWRFLMGKEVCHSLCGFLKVRGGRESLRSGR